MRRGAQINLVEANSQSLSDLMASVPTAASQPGVSVVSMSWGFPEGQAVFAAGTWRLMTACLHRVRRDVRRQYGRLRRGWIPSIPRSHRMWWPPAAPASRSTPITLQR